MNQDLVKRTRDWTKLLSIFADLGFDETCGRRPVGEIMEFIPDASTGLPPFRSALKNIEARWDLTETRWLHSLRFYFAPVPALSHGDYIAIKLIPPRSDERIPGEACIFDPLSTREESIGGVLRFAPRTDESWDHDKRLLKQTVWQKSDALNQLTEERRSQVIRIFYKYFGLIGNPSEESITMATVRRVVGKTMAFEHVKVVNERPIEEVVFYGCVADFIPAWPVLPEPHFLLSFRFAPQSRFDCHYLRRINYFLTSSGASSHAFAQDGEKERTFSGILTFAD
ncbi:MAG: hypothetical protein ABIO72_06020 [Patescibacteria group bacterium]